MLNKSLLTVFVLGSALSISLADDDTVTVCLAVAHRLRCIICVAHTCDAIAQRLVLSDYKEL